MVIDYVNNSHALLYIALGGSIGLLEIVERNDSLKVTQQRFITSPCSPGLIFKRDGTIFCFCFNYYNNRTYTRLTLARIVLPRDFKYSFVLISDSLIHGQGITFTNFLQFEYNNHFMILYGSGLTLYGVVPQTAAITKKKTNIFLTLGRDMKRIVGRYPPCYNLLCLNKTNNEIFAFCNVKIFKFSLSIMNWIWNFSSPVVFKSYDCPEQEKNIRLKFPAPWLLADSLNQSSSTAALDWYFFADSLESLYYLNSSSSSSMDISVLCYVFIMSLYH